MLLEISLYVCGIIIIFLLASVKYKYYRWTKITVDSKRIWNKILEIFVLNIKIIKQTEYILGNIIENSIDKNPFEQNKNIFWNNIKHNKIIHIIKLNIENFEFGRSQ